jgi:hypothetical protein
MGELHFRLKCTPIQSVHSGRIIGAEIVTSCGVVCAGSQCTTTLLELLYGLAFKKRERDRRFALPRWWSGGDSNRRSSLWFLALTKGSKFHVVSALKPIRELLSERSAGKFWPKTVGLRPLFQGGKRPKRTASSNPLRSTNESVRTS